jgi:hypothetical protein
MTKPKLAVWFYLIAGLLWLVIGVLRLFGHDGSPLAIVFDFVCGGLFLLLAWIQAHKQRAA